MSVPGKRQRNLNAECMRRLTGIELFIVVVALVLVVFGANMVIRPTERVIFRHSDEWTSFSLRHETKGRTRFYGACIFVLGGGLAWMALYNARK